MSVESLDFPESAIHSAYWTTFTSPIVRGGNPLFIVNDEEYAGVVGGGPRGGHVVVDYRTGEVSIPSERTFEAAVRLVEEQASLEFEGPRH